MDEDGDEDEVNKPDGRRRRSVVTNERKQAFGLRNESLNQQKVLQSHLFDQTFRTDVEVA